MDPRVPPPDVLPAKDPDEIVDTAPPPLLYGLGAFLEVDVLPLDQEDQELLDDEEDDDDEPPPFPALDPDEPELPLPPPVLPPPPRPPPPPPLRLPNFSLFWRADINGTNMVAKK